MPRVKFGSGSASSFQAVAAAIDTISFGSTVTSVTSNVIRLSSDAGDTVIRGSGFAVTPIGGEAVLTAGNINRLTFTAEDADVSSIKIGKVGLTVPELFAAVNAEETGADITALETLLLNLDWVYNGTNAVDELPEGAVSVDGVPFNLAGKDVVKLQGGDDIFFSGDGEDRVLGGAGNDQISGGDARDRLFGGADDDELSGDAGKDRLAGDAGNDMLMGGADADRLFGGEGDDALNGDEGNDRLDGGDGNDMLMGGADADKLFGRADDDVLVGGLGNDKLSGGAGSDRFVFADGDGDDVVRDFGEGDLLDLSAVLSDFTPTERDRGLLIEYDGGSVLLLGVDALPDDLIF